MKLFPKSEFPADVFTSCLTTPIKMALRWLFELGCSSEEECQALAAFGAVSNINNCLKKHFRDL
ncbi:hypothetical protein IC575_009753 [Cucumis melo]